jgi:hypothetical protein
MSVLGHFDLIIDFRTQQVHVRPNARFTEPASKAGTSRRDPFTATVVTVFAVALCMSAWFGYQRSRAR